MASLPRPSAPAVETSPADIDLATSPAATTTAATTTAATTTTLPQTSSSSSGSSSSFSKARRFFSFGRLFGSGSSSKDELPALTAATIGTTTSDDGSSSPSVSGVHVSEQEQRAAVTDPSSADPRRRRASVQHTSDSEHQPSQFSTQHRVSSDSLLAADEPDDLFFPSALLRHSATQVPSRQWSACSTSPGSPSPPSPLHGSYFAHQVSAQYVKPLPPQPPQPPPHGKGMLKRQKKNLPLSSPEARLLEIEARQFVLQEQRRREPELRAAARAVVESQQQQQQQHAHQPDRLELHTKKIKYLQLQLRDLEEEASHLRRDQHSMSSQRTTDSYSQRSSYASTTEDLVTDDEVPHLLPPVLSFDRSTSSPVLPRTSSLTWALGPSPSPSPRLTTAQPHHSSSAHPMPDLDLPAAANRLGHSGSSTNGSRGRLRGSTRRTTADGGTTTESCTESYSSASLSSRLLELDVSDVEAEVDTITEGEADTDLEVDTTVRHHPAAKHASANSATASPAVTTPTDAITSKATANGAAVAVDSSEVGAAKKRSTTLPTAACDTPTDHCVPVLNSKLTPALLHPMLILNNKVLDDRERRAIAAFLVCVQWDSQDWYDAMYAHLKLDADTIHDMEDIRRAHYEPLLFTRSIDEQHHFAVLWDALVLSLCSGRYDARNRVALRSLTSHLGVPWECIAAAEDEIAASLELKHLLQVEECDEELILSESTTGRWWKVGLGAALGGGALMLTGSLTAPLMLPAFGGLMSTVGLGALSHTAAAGSMPVIAGLFGLTGAGVTGMKIARRTAGVQEFGFEQLLNESQTEPGVALNAVIGVSGYLIEDEDSNASWRLMPNQMPFGDHYSLKWESEHLQRLGDALTSFLTTKLATEAARYWITHASSLIAATAAAVQWPIAVLGLTGLLIDNPWHNALDRAEKAGILLAQILMRSILGCRPITLVGYSTGARLIFFCLLELARNNAIGFVQDVYLLGAAVPADTEQWETAKRVVAGRLVNAYSYRDWVLSFLYRTANLSTSVAGIHPVPSQHIENVDVSHIIDGHLAYRRLVPTILEYVRAHELRDHQQQLDIVQLPAGSTGEKSKEAGEGELMPAELVVAATAAAVPELVPDTKKSTPTTSPTGSPRHRGRSPPASPSKSSSTTLFTKIRRRARSRSSSSASSSRVDPQQLQAAHTHAL